MKTLSEIEISGLFICTIIKNSLEHWPSISKELSQLFRHNKPISDDEYSCFEFALAVIAIQIQALPNLLEQQQANRIRSHVLACISAPELGTYPKEAIEEYQNAWNTSLENGNLPFDGIASVLFDKIECENKVELGGASFKAPLLLMALREYIVKFGGSWWKDAINKYQIIPNESN